MPKLENGIGIGKCDLQTKWSSQLCFHWNDALRPGFLRGIFILNFGNEFLPQASKIFNPLLHFLI